MHIPDNYLSPSTCILLAGVSAIFLNIASKKVKNKLGRKQISSIAVYSAFSFIIMMFNIPLPGGTSGHAVGGALTAVILGPWASVISTSIALIIQAIFFGDGGILSLGANIFNMGIIMPFVAYFIYHIFGKLTKNKKISAFFSGYISLNMAALITAFEFGIQPILFRTTDGLPMYSPYSLSVSIPAMLIPHLLIVGMIEGSFTVGVLSFIEKTDSSLIKSKKINPLYFFLGILATLTPIGLIAQGTAWGEWGIEEIKEKLGYIPSGMERGVKFKSLIPDYSLSNFSEITGYLISALVGILLTFIFFNLIKKLKKEKINE